MNERAPFHLLMGLVGLMATGCTVAPEATGQKKDEKGATKALLPPARVDLPPLVKLEGSIPPATHPDGMTMRIDGLVARWQKHLGKKIRVKGYLVEKYECPKDAKRCQRNHAYLHDTPAGGEKKLLLVNLSDPVRDALEIGQQYDVVGSFERRSDDGFIQSNGLLVYESIDGLEVKEEKTSKRRRR